MKTVWKGWALKDKSGNLHSFETARILLEKHLFRAYDIHEAMENNPGLRELFDEQVRAALKWQDMESVPATLTIEEISE